MLQMTRISLLLAVGLFASVSGKQPAFNLDELAAQAQAKPDDPKLHYELARAYARLDSGALAVTEYKTLLRLNAAGADDPYLRTKIASFIGLEPYPVSRVGVDTAADRAPYFRGRSNRLLFESNQDGPWQIYETTVTGDTVTRVTNDTFTSGQPASSVNGSMIAWAYVTEKGWKLALLKRGEKDAKRYADIPGVCRSPSFSPDGRTIAFQWQDDKENKNYKIALLNLKTGTVKVLTDNIYFNGKPKFSPDGRAIVYHCNENLNFDVYLTDRSGKNSHPVAASGAADYDPCFWGNNKIVFASNRDSLFQIFAYDLKTDDLLRLTSITKGEEREPIVSSDGQWLAFRSERTGRYQIFVMDLTMPISREELELKLADQ